MNLKLATGSFAGCAIGAFVNGCNNLAAFQELIGKKLAIVLIYVHWQDPFPVEEIKAIFANGSIPLLTWEPWITNPLGALESITAGYYDVYVNEFLQTAKDCGGSVLLRFAHEMNGNWYPWDGWHNGAEAGPEKYKQAWSYIHTAKQKINASNILSVFSPNNISVPDQNWNKIAAYYPGDHLVDWVAIDGYNWGYEKWQTFEQVFGPIYDEVVSISSRPLLIGEFASSAAGQGKQAVWIKEALGSLKTKYQRIKAFCWFNVNKERDWRVDSSAASLAAYKNSLQDSFFLATIA